MVSKIYIDGEAGTTGLHIRARLEGRRDLEVIGLSNFERKNIRRRREMLNSCDVAILCLPDSAAREAVALIDNPDTRVIDASTAHRVSKGWLYGMPELDGGQSKKIAEAKYISNPGCYAISAISLLRPIIDSGIMPRDWPVTINAISGYSGGGKKLISEFEDPLTKLHSEANYFVYGLELEHKHVPEIEKWSNLLCRPLLVPSVGRFAQGMVVQVPLQLGALPGVPTANQVHKVFKEYYDGRRFINVAPLRKVADGERLNPEVLNGTNELRLHVFSNDRYGQAILVGLLDNLGKGASGQAVQNLNIMLNLPEETGLERPFKFIDNQVSSV